MKLTVVGCSGSFPSAESACSSYLVEADGFRLLLDMGNGALGELQRHCGLYDLDAIFLSHLHADHCIDMCGYFVARYYRHEGGRCAPSTSEKRSLIVRPSTVTSPHSVLTDGFTLSRSICEIRLGDTPTLRATSRAVRPWLWRASRSRSPICECPGSAGDWSRRDASMRET